MHTDISRPTLLLDQDICQSNIQRMAEKAMQHNVRFKPHMKTHQSAEIGTWLKKAGANAATVSSLQMAQYFANAGWRDITIAFPAHRGQISEINELASEIDITLLINSVRTAQAFEKELTQSIKAYIEIDAGSGRTGLQSNQKHEIAEIISALNNSEQLQWGGFYSHPGHSYQCRSKNEIRNVHQKVINEFKELRMEFADRSTDFEICIGDTPCCSVATNFEGIDAISPGNFLFYDLMQCQISSCSVSDVAVAVACPIVDIYPDRNQIAIHGGAIHFSKEKMNQEDLTHFGIVATDKGEYWQPDEPPAYLTSLSQEHGIVTCTANTAQNYSIGDTIYILPVHSCLTANLMKQYHIKNEERIITQMPVS